MRNRWYAAAVAIALVLIAGMWPAQRAAELPSPARSHFRLLRSEIYDVAEWAKRLPYELAVPILARSRIRSYLDDLELPAVVRRRLYDRIDSRSFVDEVIPFVLALREVYGETEGGAVESFDAWLRRNISATETIPGMQHSMFRWQPQSEESDEGAGVFDSDLTAQLVALYDALYLQGGDPAGALEDQLACARRSSDRERATVASRIESIVRDILAHVRGAMQAEGEMAAAIDAIVAEPKRLEAVSISLVHFVDMLVCRHYRIFATRVLRENQLGDWLRAELARPGGGRLWDYLASEQEDRRYAVLTVVDGLQGHLVESLAAGRAGDRFLSAVLREHVAGPHLVPATQPSRPAPPMQIDFLEAAVEGGFSHPYYLRFFRSIYAQPFGIARSGISTTPTISVRNLPIAKTGAAVAGEGATTIPNFHFVDRRVERDGETTGRAYYFYGNDALQLESLARSTGMRTLFDRMADVSSFSCAAQYDDNAHYRVDALLNLVLGEKVRDFGELRCLAELRRRADNERELRQLRAELLAKGEVIRARFQWFQFARKRGQRDERALAEKLIDRIAALEQAAMPELLVYYNPWPDHFAHFTGPFADEILAPSGELNRLDYWLGELAGVYRRAGVAPQTLFTMAGDHGLSPIFHLLNPEVEVFDRLRARGIDVKVVKISSDEGEGPKLTHPLDPPSMRGVDAVVASTAGGNYMIDLFADHSEGWSRQPLLHELKDLELIGGGRIDIVSEIYDHLSESLDYLVVRKGECTVAAGAVTVIGARGGVRTAVDIERRRDRIRIDMSQGDLLGLAEVNPYDTFSAQELAQHRRLHERCVDAVDAKRPDTWCSEGEWRRLTSYTGRPDSVVQLAHLYDTDRAGTINLFPRFGIGYNTVVPGRHAGESFHEKDAFAGVWGAPVERSQRPSTLLIGSLAPAIYEYLSGEAAVAGTDGWGFSAVPLTDRDAR